MKAMLHRWLEAFLTGGLSLRRMHTHTWFDTGFADLDECKCGATRSTTTGAIFAPKQGATDA